MHGLSMELIERLMVVFIFGELNCDSSLCVDAIECERVNAAWNLFIRSVSFLSWICIKAHLVFCFVFFFFTSKQKPIAIANWRLNSTYNVHDMPSSMYITLTPFFIALLGPSHHWFFRCECIIWNAIMYLTRTLKNEKKNTAQNISRTVEDETYGWAVWVPFFYFYYFWRSASGCVCVRFVISFLFWFHLVFVGKFSLISV